jgi:hypothetical protein
MHGTFIANEKKLNETEFKLGVVDAVPQQSV